MQGFSGLISGTKLVTPTGDDFVEAMSVGQVITGYDLLHEGLVPAEIKGITEYTVEQVVLIRMGKDSICASPDQLFYESTRHDFVAAKDIKPGDLFVTQEHTLCVCSGIEHINVSMTMYDIELEEPHLFFVSDAHILAHNAMAYFAPAAGWFVEALKAFACFCVSRVCLYTDRPTGILSTPQQVEEKINNDTNNFSHNYYFTYDEKKVGHHKYGENYRDNFSQPTTQPLTLGGITIDLKTSQERILFPRRYGPLYLVAFMAGSGNVVCSMWVIRFSCRGDEGQAIFVTDRLGEETFRRDNPFVAEFVKAEDAKQLDDLRTLVKSWPTEVKTKLFTSNMSIAEEADCVRAQHDFYEKRIYGILFGVHAIYRMAEKRIPPSLVRHAIKHGKVQQAHNPDHVLCSDATTNVAVIVNKHPIKIINIGYCSEAQELNPPPKDDGKKKDNDKKENDPEEKDKVKTVEDVLRGTKPGKKTKGKSKQFEKEGGYEEALKDFESLSLSGIKDIHTKTTSGKVGTLPDGRIVNVRTTSSDQRPTLEIQNLNNTYTKVRYGAQ